MNKALKWLIGAAVLLLPAIAIAQDATQYNLNPWRTSGGYIIPNNSANGLKVPALGSTGSPCLSVSSTGVFATTTCGSAASGNSAWTIGNGLIYNATSTDSVLIGTSTPTSATLFVQGSGTKNPLTVASSSGTSFITVTPAGRTGFGTTNPSELIHLTGSGSEVKLQIGNTAGSGGYAELKMTTDVTDMRFGAGGTGTTPYGGPAGSGYFGVVSNHNLLFATNNTVRGMITNGGVWGFGANLSPANAIVSIGTSTVASGNNADLSIGTAYDDPTGGSNYGPLYIFSTNTQAADIGGILSLGGMYSTAGNIDTRFAVIKGAKENSTEGNYSGYMALYTRAHGSTPAERIRITSSGNVGIGTSTPYAKLQISTGATNNIVLNQSVGATNYNLISLNGSTGDTTHIGMTGGGGSDANLYLNAASGGAVILRPNGSSEKARVSSTGLGVGVTPTRALHVVYGTSAQNVAFFQNTAADGYSSLDFLDNAGITGGGVGYGNTTTAVTAFQGNAFLWGVANVVFSSNGASNERMRITTAGNVGIGSTTPIAKFAVVGTGGTNPFVIASSTGAQLITVLQSGNVGIGTTTPGASLVVQGAGWFRGTSNSAPAIRINDTATGFYWNPSEANNVIQTTHGGTAGWQIEASVFRHGNTSSINIRSADRAANSPLVVNRADLNTGLGFTTTSEIVTLAANGTDILYTNGNAGLYAVGINTSTPIATLSVRGTSTSPSLNLFNIASSSGASFLTVTNTGRFGLGTTSPQSLFTVASTTGAPLFMVNDAGHITTGGGTPAVSTCGTSPSVSGNDTAGTVTVGSGVVTSCTVTFAVARATVPKVVGCVANSALACGVTAKSTTAVTFSFSATLGGGTFDYLIVE